MTFYNELEPFAVAWLRNLAAAGHISPGRIDHRSIEDVRADDLEDHNRAHFFAGVGGWEQALDLAGVPADLSVWTGSCPCQPFSQAGSKRGTNDARHLWPVWRRLIDQCQPAVIFGEQVASPLGRTWLAAVRADLEALGYAVGAADICAAGAGAPHLRQRLWFGAVRREALAHPGRSGLQRLCLPGEAPAAAGTAQSEARQRKRGGLAHRPSSASRGLADSHSPGLDRERPPRLHGEGARRDHDGGCSSTERLADMQSGGCGVLRGSVESGQVRHPDCGSNAPEHWPGSTAGQWDTADWLLCRDAKWRPVEPGTFPLADGVSQRVGRLRAYGNAIVPQVAAAFVEAFIEGVTESLDSPAR